MSGNVFGSDSHLNEEGIAFYVDALRLEKTGELPADIQGHVDECAHCKDEIMALFDLVGELSVEEAAGHPFFHPRRLFDGAMYRAAAGVALVLGASLIAFYVMRDRPAVPEGPSAGPVLTPAAEVDSVAPSVVPHDLYAERFVPSDDLEGLAGGALRSGSVEVESPRIGEDVGREVSFLWTGGIGPEYSLEVLTNRQEVRYSVTIRRAQFVLRENLEPGLYYWKLIDGGDLVYVGKFFVRGLEVTAPRE